MESNNKSWAEPAQTSSNDPLKIKNPIFPAQITVKQENKFLLQSENQSNQYDDEDDIYIMTVEDDVVENKFSEDEERDTSPPGFTQKQEYSRDKRDDLNRIDGIQNLKNSNDPINTYSGSQLMSQHKTFIVHPDHLKYKSDFLIQDQDIPSRFNSQALSSSLAKSQNDIYQLDHSTTTKVYSQFNNQKEEKLQNFNNLQNRQNTPLNQFKGLNSELERSAEDDSSFISVDTVKHQNMIKISQQQLNYFQKDSNLMNKSSGIEKLELLGEDSSQYSGNAIKIQQQFAIDDKNKNNFQQNQNKQNFIQNNNEYNFHKRIFRDPTPKTKINDKSIISDGKILTSFDHNQRNQIIKENTNHLTQYIQSADLTSNFFDKPTEQEVFSRQNKSKEQFLMDISTSNKAEAIRKIRLNANLNKRRGDQIANNNRLRYGGSGGVNTSITKSITNLDKNIQQPGFKNRSTDTPNELSIQKKSNLNYPFKNNISYSKPGSTQMQSIATSSLNIENKNLLQLHNQQQKKSFQIFNRPQINLKGNLKQNQGSLISSHQFSMMNGKMSLTNSFNLNEAGVSSPQANKHTNLPSRSRSPPFRAGGAIRSSLDGTFGQPPLPRSEQYAQSINYQDQYIKKLKELAYFEQFVRPRHIKQKVSQNLKLKEYKRAQSVNRSSLNKLQKQSLEEDNQIRQSNSQINNTLVIQDQQISIITELQKQVKSMHISDYFKENKLKIKSALRESIKNISRDSKSQNIKIHQSNNLKSQSNDFINQIKELTQSLAFCRPEEIVPTILNTDSQKLKQDLIDQEKAMIVMKNLQQMDGEDTIQNPVKSSNQFINGGGSSIFNMGSLNKSEHQFQEHIKKEQWNSFVNYIKDRPEKVLQMVPQTINSRDNSGDKIKEKKYFKRPVSRFQTLGNEYLTAVDQSRPSSSNQSGLFNQSRLMFMRPGSRQISTAANGQRGSQEAPNIQNFSNTGISFKNFRNTVKSHYQSSGRVGTQSQFGKSRYLRLAQSRPSYVSTQPRTSMGNHKERSLLIEQKTQNKGNLLSSVKFPEKNKTPLVQIQGVNSHTPVDLSKIDTSIISIQEKAKMKLSIYKRANEKLDEIQKKLLQKKWHGYSLANDLALKLKVDEWKQNPNFNKFQRQINQDGPLRQANLIDWRVSKLKQLVDLNDFEFNSQADEKYFKPDEIEYMINLFRFNSKNFANIEQLKPVFNKSLLTLERIMDELSLGYLYDRISIRIIEISPQNTTKILLRCKLMLKYRGEIIKILQVIEIREAKMKELNYLVIQGDQPQQSNDMNASQSSIRTSQTKSQKADQNRLNKGVSKSNMSGSQIGAGNRTQKNVSLKTAQENSSSQGQLSKTNDNVNKQNNFTQLLRIRSSILKKEEREELIKDKVKELSDITDLFIQKVRDLIQVKRIFGSHFVYDGMDYIKVVINEMKQIRHILHMYGIEINLTQRSLQPEQEDIILSQDEISQIKAGSFMLNNPLLNFTQDQQTTQVNSSIAKAMNQRGFQSIFDEMGSQKDAAISIKIDNYSSAINNDSMMVGDLNTGKNKSLLQSSQQMQF